MSALYISLGIFAGALVAFGIWLFLIAPGKNPKMDYYKKIKYAHRGLHGEIDGVFYAENSLSAFRRAKEFGFGIELDVRLSSDGEVVVFHDDVLDRVTNGKGKVKDYTAKELSELSLMGTADGVPTLREVLSLIDGAVPLLVELKETGSDHSISERTAELLLGYRGEFIVESFSPVSFGAFKNQLPDVPCGLLVSKHTEKPECRTLKHRLVQRLALNFIPRPAFIAMHKDKMRLWPLPFVRALFGVPCIAWTVESKEEELRAYEDGFDTVIFEGYIPER